MKVKYRMTPFARFLIFMIFFTPIAYLGLQYYQGEDGLQKAKDLIGWDSSSAKETTSETTKSTNSGISKDRFGINESTADQIKSKEREIKELEQRIRQLKREIEGLK